MDIGQFPIALTTPLEDGAVMLRSMKGSEDLSELFHYELDVETGQDVHIADLLGNPVTVRVDQDGHDPRYFHGVVSGAQLVDCDHDKFVHQLTVRPWLWALTLNSNCRIFQDKTIPEILKEVLRASGGGDFEERLTGDYTVQEYIVQYVESDFNFLCRLMERAGIYFFFEHSQASHKLILADSISAHSKAKTCGTLPYYPPDRNHAYVDQYIWLWHAAKSIAPGAAASTDFNFKRPRALMLSRVSEPAPAPLADAEVFEYPGGFGQSSEGTECARVRLEQLRVRHDVVTGQTNARGLATGDFFELTDHPLEDQNREFLVTGAQYQVRAPLLASSGTASRDPVYECTFQALDSTQPFRPPVRSTRPRMHGPQTAIVVGRAGEEICCDEHGRIKVQFHWDRYGQSDEHSSCWIRVAHPWAGTRWGAVHIPRIGQEVIVDFLDGDPDRPIVVGSVYNGDNRPPYDLPANQTQSGIKSRSSKGGSPSNFNEIRFEDKKGNELFSVQAEKDMAVNIKDTKTSTIGTTRTTTVGTDDTTTVKRNSKTLIKGTRDRTIERARTSTLLDDDTMTIAGNRTTTIAKNKTTTVGGCETRLVTKAQAITVVAARAITTASEAITAGARAVTVAGAQITTIGPKRLLTVKGTNTETIKNNSTHAVGKSYTITSGEKITISARDQIVLKTGSASLTLKKNGEIVLAGKKMTIQGTKLSIKGSDAVTVKGRKIGQN